MTAALYILANPAVRDRAVAAIYSAEPGTVVRLGPKTRSLEQNALLWALLTDIAAQVQWPVDGKMQTLTPEDFKHILSAGLKREHRVAQGIDGGFVLLGQRTSKMTKQEMSDLIELCQAFAAEHGVVIGAVA